jgi:hypothetical protein
VTRTAGSLFVAAALAGLPAAAEAAPAAEEKLWSNETELSLVLMEGNSNTTTGGLKNTFVRRFTHSRMQWKLEAFRSTTADDWFLLVDPGYTWQPGEDPPDDPGTTLVKPPGEPDAENYFVEGRYDREIHSSLNWNAGGSWDRNKDAGILDRYIAFGGLGNLWRDKPELRLMTSYGFSWTDRVEETPDPEKDERFFGVRLSAQYRQKFGDNTTFDHDTVLNMSLTDTNDWSGDMTNSLSVSMTKRLALRVSVRWVYSHEPSLEDVDVTARVAIRDPDGIPGNGDEYFETVAEGGYTVEMGESRARKERLDQIVKTTLVVSF